MDVKNKNKNKMLAGLDWCCFKFKIKIKIMKNKKGGPNWTP